MNTTPKRLAITISGAVSLGSYEAGVLFEVLSALAAHNQQCNKPEDRIEVDVLTGASAGGMTAAIAGQILLGRKCDRWLPYDNPFYNAWVDLIDLKQLARLNEGEDPMHSLLSSDAVSAIAAQLLPTSFATPEPHRAAAEKVWLGLALTNLNGVDYHAPAFNGVKFTYTRYQDRLTRDVTDKPDWAEIRAAALACGAFPIAFRVRELVRDAADYFPGQNASPWKRAFAYTDGGVFDNQPLGMARNLAAKIDQPGENDRRFYLFVSPWPKSSSIAKNPLQAKDATLVRTATALVSAVFNQGRFKDWVMAEEVNADLQTLNKRAEQLAKLLLAQPGLVTNLGPAAAALAVALTTEAEVPQPDLLVTERARLIKEFTPLGTPPTDYYAKLQQASHATADAWIDTLLVLEYAAQLSDKAEMVIYDIYAGDEELAGHEISAFAGFFDQRFRRHDYEVGRQKAREWLAKLRHAPAEAGGIPTLAPIVFTPPATDVPAPDLSVRNLPLKDMPKGPRQVLRDLVAERTDRLVDDNIEVMLVGSLIRWWLKKKLRSLIGSKLGL